MFEVIEKKTGKRCTAYAVDHGVLLVGVEDGFILRDASFYAPVPQGNSAAPEAAPCVFSTVKCNATDLDGLLSGITSGAIPVKLGDMISTRLLDGTEVDFVVTDQDSKTVRLESRDCLGMNISARGLDEYLGKVYMLLPDALKNRITEVERAHLDSDGKRYTERCKIFVPAASELFPPDEYCGDEGLYEQLEWYKDVHNRIRADCKGGDSHWYWTSSPYSGNSCYFCSVGSNGDANGNSASSAGGLAPFGCIISKTC